MHGLVHHEFSLRLLGRFAVATAKDPAVAVRISSKKGCALLALLAMQPENLATREHLSTMLWGDRFDKSARQNLRQCIASLREDLSPFEADLLSFERDTVALRTHRLTVDVHEFARLAQSTEPSDLGRAAELYHGEFLTGFSLEIEPFDDWLRAERGRLESMAAHVFEALAEAMDRLGDSKQAIAAAERLIALDNLREDWHRLLLRLYARHRSPEAAMAHAKSLTDLLKRELDVGIDPATAALVADIRRSMLAPASGQVTMLPRVDAGAEEAFFTPCVPDAVDAGSHPAMSVRPRASRLALSLVSATVVLSLSGYWLLAHNAGLPFWPIGGSAPSGIAANSGTSWLPPSQPWNGAAAASDLTARAIIPIIVLPFTTPAGDRSADQTVADAITEDLITNLSRFQELRVISSQSAFSYKGRPVDATAIGAELGVRYLIEGSIRTQGALARINIRLIDTTSRLQVWSDQFERDEAQHLVAQGEIAKRLARAIQVQVPAALSRRTNDENPLEPAIHQLIAKGQTANLRGPAAANLLEARGYFEEALRRQPDLVPALIGIAGGLIMESLNFIGNPAVNLQIAEPLLDRAGALAPDSALVPYWKGLLAKARGQYDLALRSMSRALELNPSLASAHQQIGSILTLSGHADQAMPHILYGMRLSPRDPTRGIGCLLAGMAEMELGHDSAALDWFQQSAMLVPNNPNIYRLLAAAYALTGDKLNAAAAVTDFKRIAPPESWARLVGAVHRSSEGKTQRSRALEGFALALESSS